MPVHSEDNELFRFGIAQFGRLVKCSGRVWTEVDDKKFGAMNFTFKKEAELTVVTEPLGASIVKIESKTSFPSEAGAINLLKKTVEKTGLKNFDAFINSDLWWRLREWGLLIL